jgi:hypothetical protein
MVCFYTVCDFNKKDGTCNCTNLIYDKDLVCYSFKAKNEEVIFDDLGIGIVI